MPQSRLPFLIAAGHRQQCPFIYQWADHCLVFRPNFPRVLSRPFRRAVLKCLFAKKLTCSYICQANESMRWYIFVEIYLRQHISSVKARKNSAKHKMHFIWRNFFGKCTASFCFAKKNRDGWKPFFNYTRSCRTKAILSCLHRTRNLCWIEP